MRGHGDAPSRLVKVGIFKALILVIWFIISAFPKIGCSWAGRCIMHVDDTATKTASCKPQIYACAI